MKLSNIKANPTNPRIIKDDKFDRLVKSLQDFPEMMEKRPMVCVTDADGKIYPLGGNMRFRALQHLGYKEIPDTWVLMADDWTEDQRREFTVKDNVGFGEWDWDELANNWDSEQLSEWGVDIPDIIDKSIENEVIDLGIKQSIQVLPKNEYIIITEPESSEEWEELKTLFKLETVRSGGCKIGSTSDNASIGLERVFNLKTFKERFGI